jgi:GTP-binding protein HflX
MILTDTVGFIQKLPTELVEAFAATLEEVRQAHVLAIVVDGSHPDAELHLTTVLETLADMECDQPSLLLINTIDRLDVSEQRRVRLSLGDIAAVSPLMISATRNLGLRELRQALDAIAADLVPDTRANRPIMAATTIDSQVPVHRAAG